MDIGKEWMLLCNPIPINRIDIANIFLKLLQIIKKLSNNYFQKILFLKIILNVFHTLKNIF